ESALYARVFTEGMLGIEPTGLNSFNIKPQLPTAWEEVSLYSCHLLGRNLDFIFKSTGNVVNVEIYEGNRMLLTRDLPMGKEKEIVLN
ncbi:MAG: six-hairpin glycosidase-like protein, partial [Bacteroidetes bacterium]